MGKILNDKIKGDLVFNESPDGICLLDSKAIIVDCNAALRKMQGYSKKEMVGRPMKDFISPKFLSTLKRGVKTAQKKGYFEAEILLRRKDGSEFWVWRKVKALYEGKKAVGLLAYTRDISERRESEEIKKENLKFKSEIKQKREIGEM